MSCFEALSFYLFPSDQNRNGELFKILLSVVGALGILFGLYASWKRALAMENGVLRQKEALEMQSEQIAITRKAQTDERFKNAVEHLGSEKEPIILGGIAELNQIAKENKDEYSEIVFNILCSYIRTSADIYNKLADEINTTIIQTIVNNLFKNDKSINKTYSGLNANLSSTNLLGIDLNYTDLSNADLSFCYMPSLKNTTLKNAELGRTIFTLSDIENVSFLGAKMHKTLFLASELSNVDMSGDTDLLSTVFIDSDLNKINFNDNSIISCKFIACDIRNVTFQSSEVASTNFCGSLLQNIDFIKINLFGSNDFRATGFINVNIDTVVTQSKFNGCRSGRSYRYFLKEKIKTDLGNKADLSGININSTLLSNCSVGDLTEEDIDEIINEYDKCMELKDVLHAKKQEKKE